MTLDRQSSLVETGTRGPARMTRNVPRKPSENLRRRNIVLINRSTDQGERPSSSIQMKRSLTCRMPPLQQLYPEHGDNEEANRETNELFTREATEAVVDASTRPKPTMLLDVVQRKCRHHRTKLASMTRHAETLLSRGHFACRFSTQDLPSPMTCLR